MNNAPAILRAFIIYAVCVALAIFFGFLVTNPLDVSTMVTTGIVAAVLCFPLLLRWHYPLLLLSLNMSAILFFLPGRPNFWMMMIVLSFGISLVQRALSRNMRFLFVPPVAWSLICLTGIVLLTAKLNGGIGFHSLGGEIGGGRHYLGLLLGVLLYFALTAHRIPPERANLYVALFFLGGMTSVITDFYSVVPSSLNFIFWVFPPTVIYSADPVQLGSTRLGGVGGFGNAVVMYMLARYGIRGIFSGTPWRAITFIGSFAAGLLGGYRAYVLCLGLIFMFQFYLEGLHRTKWLPKLVFAGVVGLIVLIPLTPRLPFTFQRAVSFIPFLPVEHEATQSGEDTMDWRIKMWTAMLPMVPRHLLLGKGYTITQEDYQMMGRDTAFQTVDPSQQGLALSSDYHNGTLSVLIPFGMWGAIAFIWFLIAGGRVLYLNLRHGDPALRSVNTVLLAYFAEATLTFFIGGALNTDMLRFAGMVGLSVALNGGVREPSARPLPSARRTILPVPGTRAPVMDPALMPDAARLS